MASEIHELFGTTASAYAQFRPSYPERLFVWLAEIAPTRRHAWDCGAGSGQAAWGLAQHFDRVSATDRSLKQLRNARSHPRIDYWVAGAERCALADGCVDLVCVAQALHWFDPERFFAEVRRVAHDGAGFVAWTYNLLEICPTVDAVISQLYQDILAGYWPRERRLVENAYADMELPFERIEPPRFELAAHWSLAQCEGYLGTWSAVARYREARGRDPVAELGQALAAAWGDPSARRPVRWPLTLLAGRIH